MKKLIWILLRQDILITEYDALGRPVKSKAAVNTANEVWTQVEYDDLNRRVITRGDLFAVGDGKAVSIAHYDQLGRVRLARSLENATTEDAYNEADGIKVQTRYDTANPYSYAVTSNPYRAATSTQAGGEATMGWTRSKSWNTGRRGETETFSGAALPAPWGSNGNSTGIVVTETDANAAIVTDQAGKQRRSITNALGQLTRVDEPDAAGNLGSISSPTQATYYSYNTSGNMVEVTQGVQKRYFLYDSLGRLVRVRQPEQTVNTALNLSGNGTSNTQWTTGSTYDANGNVLTTTDAENVTTGYSYDQLNRTQTRTYSDGTPTVTFTYDDPNVAFSKGQLTKTSNAVSTSQITAFDNMGRVLSSQQITDGQSYTSSYQYNLSGRLTQETYPTGRVITNTFDNNGDLSQIAGQKGGVNKTYADSFAYTSSGHIEKLRVGNGLWEAAKLNSRMQVTEVGLGTSATNLNLWKINLDYGELNTDGTTVNTTKNTGNIAKQTTSFNGLAQPFVQTYKYDSLDRLTEAKETNNGTQTWKQTFGYDRFGNRTSFSQIIGATQLPINNQTLPSIDPNTNRFQTGQGYTYDFNGNLIADAEGRQFSFNADNKQTQVKDASNNVVGQYYYDGNGKRIKKITAQETITFVYSGGKLVAEYSTQTPQSQATTKYVATDTLGSVRAITDQNGNIVSRRDFMPFGEDLYAGTPNRSTNDGYKVIGDSVKQRFTGYERDDETGLDFAEARYYKNDHGRFTAVDPLLASGKSVNPQTFNRYVYVRWSNKSG
jgi:RHS repeat-associated protein